MGRGFLYPRSRVIPPLLTGEGGLHALALDIAVQKDSVAVELIVTVVVRLLLHLLEAAVILIGVADSRRGGLTAIGAGRAAAGGKRKSRNGQGGQGDFGSVEHSTLPVTGVCLAQGDRAGWQFRPTTVL